MKRLFLFILMLSWYSFINAQKSSGKILYVIDSIPVITNPEDWNIIKDTDIDGISVVKNKDSLKMLGWPKMEAITYIFTKAYRNRPDIIKRIPSLKQMRFKDSLWIFNNKPYSGRYIDYYLSGAKQTEGEMLDGKINGKIKTFFQCGSLKSEFECKNGIYDGEETDYFINGNVFCTKTFISGEEYFNQNYYINGQPEWENKKGINSVYDTSINYYSTGKIKKITIVKRGIGKRTTKKENDIACYSVAFYTVINQFELKQADRYLKKILKLKNEDDDTYFMKGILSEKLGKYDEAVSYFDSVLNIEPMYRAALVNWSLCTIKKYSGNKKEISIENFKNIPTNGQIKVCKYLKLAEDIDPKGFYVKQNVPNDILNYCSGGE